MVTLRDKNVGDIIKIKENGELVDFIIVHKGNPDPEMYDESCDGVWVLRKRGYDKIKWSDASNNYKSDYENSNIHSWLNKVFFNIIEPYTRDSIKNVKIPFKKGSGNTFEDVQTGTDGLSCKIFLLGMYEVGLKSINSSIEYQVDGVKLSYFLNNDEQNAMEKRICKDTNEYNSQWWLRTAYPNLAGFAVAVNTDGSYTTAATNYELQARPSFILPYDISLKKDGSLFVPDETNIDIKQYDDPTNPDTSEFRLLIPKTTTEAVRDPVTNRKLSDIITEYDQIFNDTEIKGVRGSRWNTGTAISGTNTSGAAFSTGISDSLVGDMYLNTTTSDIYRCTVAGDQSTALWVWVANIKGIQGEAGAKGDKGDPGNNATVTVDSELNSTSTNPVQNKVINKALDDKADVTNPVFTGSISVNRKSNTDTGVCSAAFGNNCTASGNYSTAFGNACTASGGNSVAFGNGSEASKSNSAAFGNNCTASGDYSAAFGSNSKSSGNNSVAFGGSVEASGNHSAAFGNMSKALGRESAAFGNGCIASGGYSVAFGAVATASGNYSAAFGKHNNNTDLENEANPICLLAVGFGKSSAKQNVFRVSYEGQIYAMQAAVSTGADYAEFVYPWFDDNIENEDRRGYFVTVMNEKLYKAEPGDPIIGITSGNPSVVGNGDEGWVHRFKRDEFGALIFEEVEVDDYDYVTGVDDKGQPYEQYVKVGSHFELHNVEVENYDKTLKYVERKDRSEWSYVGMLGVIPLRDDGTCSPGSYAKCGGYGIATKADRFIPGETFLVLKRINDHLVSVLMR